VRVAEARVGEEPLRKVGAVAWVRRKDGFGRWRRGQAGERRRHPPRVADAAERRRDARATDAREEVLEVHAQDDGAADVRRHERAHAVSRHKPVRDLGGRNRREYVVD
jgi:hypothetical protein